MMGHSKSNKITSNAHIKVPSRTQLEMSQTHWKTSELITSGKFKKCLKDDLR